MVVVGGWVVGGWVVFTEIKDRFEPINNNHRQNDGNDISSSYCDQLSYP